jgi:hypothetical protein
MACKWKIYNLCLIKHIFFDNFYLTTIDKSHNVFDVEREMTG